MKGAASWIPAGASSWRTSLWSVGFLVLAWALIVLADALMKSIAFVPAIDAWTPVEWNERVAPGLGLIRFLALALGAMPTTSPLGSLLLMADLGALPSPPAAPPRLNLLPLVLGLVIGLALLLAEPLIASRHARRRLRSLRIRARKSGPVLPGCVLS